MYEISLEKNSDFFAENRLKHAKTGVRIIEEMYIKFPYFYTVMLIFANFAD